MKAISQAFNNRIIEIANNIPYDLTEQGDICDTLEKITQYHDLTGRPSFEQAKAQYVYRFTMEHIPQWARKPCDNGKYYAPQYRTDREWYENTLFHGESECADKRHCYTSGQTWPLGKWLDAPLTK